MQSDAQNGYFDEERTYTLRCRGRLAAVDTLAKCAAAFLECHHQSLRIGGDDIVTDESLENRISEIIREASLDGVRDELPHSLAVTIDDIIEREDGSMTDIYANIFVERDSQKAIVIGHGGSRLREVGTKSREQIEPLIGGKVFLSLRVKVAKDWQRDPKQLGRLGF